MTLYTNTLAEEFDDHAGRLLYYIDAQGNVVISNVHYNLRAFYGDDITVPRTMSDMRYWNVSSFDTDSMLLLDTPRSVTGRTVAARTIAAVEALSGTQLEGSSMSTLNSTIISSGNENWTVDANITVGKDAAERYANSIQVNLTNGVTKTATSVFSDNILQDFNVQGANYFIELALPNFPSQTALVGSTTVTASGNEITDATRTANVQGDGRAAPDSSFGIWEASTNLIRNGGAESAPVLTTDYNNYGGGTRTLTQDTSTFKFGATSYKDVVAGDAANQGFQLHTNTGLGLPAGTIMTGSAWVNAPSGLAMAMSADITNTDATQTVGTPTTFTGTGTWQRVTCTTTVGAGKTGDKVSLALRMAGTSAATFWVDGAQVEQKSVATPYIHTNGAPASRTAARVQAPMTGAIASQGWIAFRLRTGVPLNSTVPSRNIWAWGDGPTGRMYLYYVNSGQYFDFGFTSNGTSFNETGSAVGTWNAGDFVTVVARWTTSGTNTNLGISVNGSAFATTTWPFLVPNFTSTLADLGASLGASAGTHWDGDILWYTRGNGTLANADAATLNALGNTDPTMATLPSGAETAFVWSASTTSSDTAAAKLDLDNSWIDFSSDPTFATQTDSFRFSDSLHNVAAGGDTYWQINRNSLVNANLSNLQAVRFRLLSEGNMTFKAQALRMYRQDLYNWPVVDIDTKRNTFRRSIPRDSGTEPAPVPYGTSGSTVLYFNYPRPSDGTHNVKFNSGHIPVAPNQNYLAIQARRDNASNSHLEFQLISNSTNTTIKTYQRINGVLSLLDTTVGPALTAETFYYFNVDYHGTTIQANIKNVTAAFYGSTFLQTPQVQATLTNRGYVGFDFNPYNYDFYIESINASDARFASFVSKAFPAITPYASVTLSTKETEPINLLPDNLIAAGDATVTVDLNARGRTNPKKVIRDGTTWQGGIMSDDYNFIGNTNYTTVNVDIYPFDTLQGIWRLVFLDRWDSVGWMDTIRGLLPNQWNNVNVPINSALAAGSYRVILQQVGNYASTFWVDNFQLNHLANAWEASPDNGLTWIPFGTSINKPYSGINFKGQTGTTSIKIRSSALSDTAWVAEYEVIPNYAYSGRPRPHVPTLSSQSWSGRITGTLGSSYVQTGHITGQFTSGTLYSANIFGILGSSFSQAARITGQATTLVTKDMRVTGTNSTTATQDIRVTGDPIPTLTPSSSLTPSGTLNPH
jgi:hypothetical protein